MMNLRAYKISERRILPINSLKAICINSERLTEQEWQDLVIMRGTGTFDNKGNEIFEGDFCRNEVGECGEVFFSEGCFWLGYFDEPAKQALYTFQEHFKPNTGLVIIGLRSFNEYHTLE